MTCISLGLAASPLPESSYSSSERPKSLLEHIDNTIEHGHHRNLKFDITATLVTDVLELQYYLSR